LGFGQLLQPRWNDALFGRSILNRLAFWQFMATKGDVPFCTLRTGVRQPPDFLTTLRLKASSPCSPRAEGVGTEGGYWLGRLPIERKDLLCAEVARHEGLIVRGEGE